MSSRVDTVNYLKGDSPCYCGLVQITKDSNDKEIVMDGSHEHYKLIEDCLKDLYEQVSKFKDKIKKLEAKILILEKTDDNSTLIN